jgi:hypothetical protein
MSATRSRRATALAALASIALVATLAVPAAAVEPTFVFDFPAPDGCQDFDLRITGYGEGQQVFREFTRAGETVQYLAAGTGNALTYTNLSTSAEISTRSNGAVSWTTVYPDGSARLTLLGHNLVILFSTDAGGPGTWVYSGRVIINVAADGTWAEPVVHGTSIDVCAALAS